MACLALRAAEIALQLGPGEGNIPCLVVPLLPTRLDTKDSVSHPQLFMDTQDNRIRGHDERREARIARVRGYA